MCFLGLGCSSSSSSNSTTNTSTTIDNRVGLDNGATYVGAGASVNVDSHNVTTDQGAVTGAFEFGSQAVGAITTVTKAGLDANAAVSGQSIDGMGKVSETAINKAVEAAGIAADAARRTASDAISAITSDAADSRALARTLGVDAIQFAHDTASGFIDASAGLNKLVGTLSQNNGEFLSKATDQILARSQSADQQNFEATLSMLKWVAGAAAVALVATKFARA